MIYNIYRLSYILPLKNLASILRNVVICVIHVCRDSFSLDVCYLMLLDLVDDFFFLKLCLVETVSCCDACLYRAFLIVLDIHYAFKNVDFIFMHCNSECGIITNF